MNKKLIKTFLFFFLIVLLTGCNKKKQELYEHDFNFLNQNIHIKLYTTSSSKAEKIFEELENIYNKYQTVIDKEIVDISNKKINNLKISNELSELIETGIKWYDLSNGLININKGNLVLLWDEYRKSNSVPSKDEVNDIDISIDNIDLKNNYLSGQVNLNFDDYINGYVDRQIKDYLKDMHINYYFINSGTHILVGDNYEEDNYNVALTNPFDESSLEMLTVNNKYIVTKSIYYNSYEYEDEIYSNIINPLTRYLSNNIVSVTVLGDDPLECDILATMLFMMDYEQGYELTDKYNVQALWYYYDIDGNEIVKRTNNLR